MTDRYHLNQLNKVVDRMDRFFHEYGGKMPEDAFVEYGKIMVDICNLFDTMEDDIMEDERNV